MNKVFEKIIEKQKELFQDLNAIEVLSHVDFDSTIQNSLENFLKAITNEAIEIVKQEAERYEECYKDCGECEAYNKEKYHCPKFCKVIKETVKEIEENHNKGKWEMTYKGKRKDVNTGLMISAYNCKCSVCGWETGNQGTRFNYCPNCGAKMDKVIQPNGENDENN